MYPTCVDKIPFFSDGGKCFKKICSTPQKHPAAKVAICGWAVEPSERLHDSELRITSWFDSNSLADIVVLKTEKSVTAGVKMLLRRPSIVTEFLYGGRLVRHAESSKSNHGGGAVL